MPTPLKRHTALQPLSHDHHHGLLLCFKIRQGLKKEVAPQRIYAYLNYFFERYLSVHFREEEQHLFPLLGPDHPGVIRAQKEHQQLRECLTAKDGSTRELAEAEALLKAHIRFEERELFNEIQEKCNDRELRGLTSQLTGHDTPSEAEWSDHFWD